ncbi:MAG: hypothetical protein DRJ98_07885 [Thermoprotei archaeon]|nr:MAG: hypothetical protein DRJ98_07885 [Thermoprotei archaeon]
MFKISPIRMVASAAAFIVSILLLYYAPVMAMSEIKQFLPPSIALEIEPSPLLLPSSLFFAAAAFLTILLRGGKGLLTMILGLAGIIYIYALFNGGALTVYLTLTQPLEASVEATVSMHNLMYLFMASPAVMVLKGVFDFARAQRS